MLCADLPAAVQEGEPEARPQMTTRRCAMLLPERGGARAGTECGKSAPRCACRPELQRAADFVYMPAVWSYHDDAKRKQQIIHDSCRTFQLPAHALWPGSNTRPRSSPKHIAVGGPTAHCLCLVFRCICSRLSLAGYSCFRHFLFSHIFPPTPLSTGEPAQSLDSAAASHPSSL